MIEINPDFISMIFLSL